MFNETWKARALRAEAERDAAYIALRQVARAIFKLPTDINIGAEYDIPQKPAELLRALGCRMDGAFK